MELFITIDFSTFGIRETSLEIHLESMKLVG